jgi:uridine kinase
MLILIAGLPRAGKSSFADAVVSLHTGYTHVPLDKYIREVPEACQFLDWVASPNCIDWLLLERHLHMLQAGHDCYTPAPDWSRRGRRSSDGGVHAGGRLMQPASRGYLIPGCHAFRFPVGQERSYRIFIDTPRSVIAERLLGRPVLETEVTAVFNQHLSPNWQEIEAYTDAANLVISGITDRSVQVATLMQELDPA